MTDCDHEEILQALMNTTIRAQKAEATIARHEDTIAGLRAFPAIAERDAALRQNADLQAANNRLLERARDAEQQAADSQHAVQIYCDDYNKAIAERDAAIAAKEKAEAFGVRAERATLILADEFEMDGDTILRLKAERDAATARAEKAEVERDAYSKNWLPLCLERDAALEQVAAMRDALDFYSRREIYIARTGMDFPLRRDNFGDRARAALNQKGSAK